MTIYTVKVISFSFDIMEESHIKGYFSSRDKAEDYILKRGLLDQGWESVEVVSYQLDPEVKGETNE